MTETDAGRAQPQALKKTALVAARVAPWVVFGPITGVLTEVAFRCYRSGRPVAAALVLALNVAILLAIPATTAVLAARL